MIDTEKIPRTIKCYCLNPCFGGSWVMIDSNNGVYLPRYEES